MPANGKPKQLVILAGILLGLSTLGVYLPALGLDFINYDDPQYVIENPAVRTGLSGQSLGWAFSRFHSGNWHPLTWLSHMLDCQMYGLNPAGHHFTNVLFHTANTLVLFLLLRSLTRAIWRCALVAALFAIHPLHVESVAWVSERKDVLSTFFGFLAIWAYGGYVRKVEGQPSKSQNVSRSVLYSLTLLFFVLSLMSKPMLVTLPFVLLLLDFWPLRRLPSQMDGGAPSAYHKIRALLLEKLPFLALAAG